MEIHLGCSGWFYWHWRGLLYPVDAPTKSWFPHYTGTFDTVELNAPFYRWPRPATVRRWVREAPATFHYSVKVNQEITHERKMVRTKRLIQDFYEIGPLLGSQLGCFLFQFPPSYKYTAARLKCIVAQLDPRWRNVVEFRHRSWWRQAVDRAFAKRGITFCAVSSPRLAETLPPRAERLYVRFHGRSRWYRHDYTTEELTVWAQRIANSGAKEAWLYFNNDREGYALKNALELRALLAERL
ncbi:MAG: DUF72 domain-containing protein [Opitutaceae bacterium]